LKLSGSEFVKTNSATSLTSEFGFADATVYQLVAKPKVWFRLSTTRRLPNSSLTVPGLEVTALLFFSSGVVCSDVLHESEVRAGYEPA
jgi:hypothetical protein